MGKTVFKRRFLDTWRIGEIESWLTDMAAQGLHLVNFGASLVRFERGESENMRYRVDFTQAEGYAMEEQLTLYAENSWEFVCDLPGCRIFRSPDSLNAPELHTDPAEQAFVIRRLHRRMIASAIGVIAFSLLMTFIAISLQSVSFVKPPLLSLIELFQLTLPASVTATLVGIVSSVRSLISVGGLIKSMREGRAINHRADWKRLRRFWRIGMTMLYVAYLSSLALLLIQYALHSTEELPLVDSGQMYLRLSDIETDSALERREFPRIDDFDWGNYVMRTWSPFAPVMLTISENGIVSGRMWSDGSGEYSPSIDVNLYRLRFPWLVDSVFRDLLSYHYPDYDAALYERADKSGFDRLLVISRDDFYQNIFASKDNTVVRVRYIGEEDIDAVIKAVRLWLEGI